MQGVGGVSWFILFLSEWNVSIATGNITTSYSQHWLNPVWALNTHVDLSFQHILWIDQLIEPEGHKLLGKTDQMTEDWEDPLSTPRKTGENLFWQSQGTPDLADSKIQPTGTRKTLAQSLETVPKHKGGERFQSTRNPGHCPSRLLELTSDLSASSLQELSVTCFIGWARRQGLQLWALTGFCCWLALVRENQLLALTSAHLRNQALILTHLQSTW